MNDTFVCFGFVDHNKCLDRQKNLVDPTLIINAWDPDNDVSVSICITRGLINDLSEAISVKENAA